MIANEITEKIIGCAIEVHKHLGLGLLESAYEECLYYELINNGLEVKKQVALPLVYKGIRLDAAIELICLLKTQLLLK